MEFKFIDSEEIYNGSQLRALHNYSRFGVQGDSIISWIGGCDIPVDKIVDVEDILADQRIYSKKMLNFIIEIFEHKLFSAVCLQRLFCDEIRNLIYKKTNGEISLFRKGDDLYHLDSNKNIQDKPVKDEDSKLNISIASVSPTSALMHIGINIESEATPVKTCSLEDFKIDPKSFSLELMQLWCEEYESARKALCKVKWVN